MKKFTLITIIILAFCAINSAVYANQPKKLLLRQVPKLNLAVPFLGLGTVELGRDWGIGGKNSQHPQDKVAKDVLMTAMAHGLTVVDTASSYQLSEERIGRYIPRSTYHYLLITKPGEHSISAKDPRCKKTAYDNIYCSEPAAEYDFSRAAIYKDVMASLQYLKVNTLDIVLLHLNNQDANNILAKGEAVKALEDLRAEHKIRYIGVSVNGAAAITAAKMQNLDFLETEYSLINQNNAKAIQIAHSNGMGVIVRGALGTGLLTPYVANHLKEPNLPYGQAVRALVKLTNNNYDQLTALALAFVYENPYVSTVIVGADKPEFILKDLVLLNNFKDAALLTKAKKLAKNFTPPDYFTENMGEYYAKKTHKAPAAFTASK